MNRSYLWPYIEKMALRILNLIDPYGGYPATKEGDVSCPWTTASLPASVISVLGPRPQDESKHRLTIQWLHQNDEHDGLFPMVQGTQPSIDTTAAVFELLSRVQLGYTLEKEDYEYAEKIGRHLLDSQKGGWSFLFKENEPLPFSTYWVLRSLDVGGKSFPSLRNRIEKAFDEAGNWLLSIKTKSGWYGQSKKVGDVYTAAALLSLKLCNKIDEVNYDKLCGNIAKKNEDKILWNDGVERHGGLTVVRFALPWCVATLSKASFPNYKNIIDICIAELLNQSKDDKIFYKDTELNTWPSRDTIICLSETARSPYSLSLSELLIATHKMHPDEYKHENSETPVSMDLKEIQRKINDLARENLEKLHKSFKPIPTGGAFEQFKEDIFGDIDTWGGGPKNVVGKTIIVTGRPIEEVFEEIVEFVSRIYNHKHINTIYRAYIFSESNKETLLKNVLKCIGRGNDKTIVWKKLDVPTY